MFICFHVCQIPVSLLALLSGCEGRKGACPPSDVPARGRLDALVSLVTEQCDVTRPSGGEKPVVQVTGIGANFFKQELESKLQVT